MDLNTYQERALRTDLGNNRKFVWCGKDDTHEPHIHKGTWCNGFVPLVTWKDWMGGG